MTHASNALTTVDLTGALWSHYWKKHPPSSEVTLRGGDQSTVCVSGRHPAADMSPDGSTVKRKPLRDSKNLEPVACKA